MAPSLVTWPTRKTGVSVVLAKAMNRPATSRIWVTVPGALGSSGRYWVWMESMATTAGWSASATRRIFWASVSASTWRFGAPSRSRSARSFTWRADSSPDT